MTFLKGHPVYKGSEKGWFGTRPPWNKGKKTKGHKQTAETRNKISQSKLKLYRDKTKHPSYQFGKCYATNYGRIHTWLKEQYGKANKCENKNCPGFSKTFDFAKKPHAKYEPNRDNFMMLCRSCHMKMDKSIR